MDFTRDGAGFRALRAVIGASSSDMACVLRVQERAITRWDNGTNTIPAGVWSESLAIADAAGERVRRAVSDALAHAGAAGVRVVMPAAAGDRIIAARVASALDCAGVPVIVGSEPGEPDGEPGAYVVRV